MPTQDRAPSLAEASTPDGSLLLVLSVLAGLFSVVLLNYVTSFDTNDDFYAGQLSSLYGDGRFIIGLVVEQFYRIFVVDAYFRILVNFVFGAVGFLSLISANRLYEIHGRLALVVPFIILGVLSANAVAFWYDISSLSVSLAFPALAIWWGAAARAKTLSQFRSRATLVYAATTAGVTLYLSTLNQVYLMVLIATEVSLYFLASRGEFGCNLRRSIAFFGSLAAGVAVYSAFIGSGLYSALFMPLRGRNSTALIPAVSSLDFGALLDLVLAAPSVQFQSLFPLLLVLTTLVAAVWRDPHVSRISFSIGFIAMVLFTFANPLMFLVTSSDNGRVHGAVYTFALAASIYPAISLLARQTAANQVLTTRLVVGVFVVLIGFTVVSALLASSALREASGFGAVFLIIATQLAIAISMAGVRIRVTTGLVVALAVCVAIQFQANWVTTNRWQRDAMIDEAIVTQIDEAIIANQVQFPTEGPITLEFGVSQTDAVAGSNGRTRRALPGTRIKLYDYSAASFLRNHLIGFSYRMQIVQNDEMCAEQPVGVSVLESRPGYLAVCY